MTVAAIRVSGAVLAVFVLLTLTFLILAWGEFADVRRRSPSSAATSASLTALAAWYASFAGVTAFTLQAASSLPVGPALSQSCQIRRCLAQ